MTSGFGHDRDRFSEMVERVAAEIRQQAQQSRAKPPRQVAQSTWDAVLWVLRENGISRFYDPWVLERLERFSPEQLDELIAALTRLKTKPLGRRVTEELIEAVKGLRGKS